MTARYAHFHYSEVTNWLASHGFVNLDGNGFRHDDGRIATVRHVADRWLASFTR